MNNDRGAKKALFKVVVRKGLCLLITNLNKRMINGPEIVLIVF